MVKNKINTYLFKTLVQGSYTKVLEVENKEEVYYQKNKLAVYVKDKELGKRIYDIVKAFKDNKIQIRTPKCTFEIYKYVSDEDNAIELFYIFLTFEAGFKDLSKIERLEELIHFIQNMEIEGFEFDNSNFDYKNCNCISEFLSYFLITDNNQTNRPIYNIIKYIHYYLSEGQDFDEFYNKIHETGICNKNELPYNIPIAKMCYEYYKNKVFMESILEVLISEEVRKNEDSTSEEFAFIMFDKDIYCANASSVENSNNNYIVCDGNIKIYDHISDDFLIFFTRNLGYYSHLINEEIHEYIVDLRENIIGYTFSMADTNSESILKSYFKDMSELIMFFQNLDKYILENNWYICQEQNDFSIKNSVKRKDDSFEILTVKEFFNLLTCSESKLQEEMTKLFFDLLAKLLNEKYGKLETAEEILSKDEVKYLSPLMARGYINHVLKTGIESNCKISEFIRKYKAKSESGIIYDDRLMYNPDEVPFLFDFEVEQIYGIDIERGRGIDRRLSDNSIFKCFLYNSTIESVYNEDWEQKQNLYEKIKFDEDLKLNKISKIVYSRTIGDKGIYEVIGYIKEACPGEKITQNTLLNMTNKDFLKIAGILLSKFGKYYIDLEYLYMDDAFKFYLDVDNLNKIQYNHVIPSFRISRVLALRDAKKEYFVKLLDYLKDDIGCSPNKLVDLEQALEDCSYEIDKNLFLKLANSLDAYCEEHEVYYNSKFNVCPICNKTKYYISEYLISNASKVYEDKYAIHYNVNREYNLKVYKKDSGLNLDTIQHNIDKILESKNPYASIKSIQDCFIPVKKAINENHEFIGCIYNTVKFDGEAEDPDICVSLKDLTKMKNLHRLKAILRLINQEIFIKSSGFEFTSNPFGDVFLIKSHKKQVQIVNIEFLRTINSSSSASIDKIVYDYICDVLKVDPSIDVTKSDSNMKKESRLIKIASGRKSKLQVLHNRLVELSRKMTRYCPIHQTYYTTDYLFCPECVDPSELSGIDFETVDPQVITSLEQINEGGEAFIRNYDNKLVAKEFKQNLINSELKNRILLNLMKKKSVLEEVNKNKKLKYKYIVPKRIFVDQNTNNIFAYVMDEVEGTSIANLRDKVEVKRFGFTRQDIFEILITVGRGIENLHNLGFYIGDLNGRNILFDANKNVYFLDFDGMGTEQIAPEFCTDGYIDPISKKNKNITMKDDWYSFAVQVFYYLTYTHPFGGIYSVKENGKDVMLEVEDKMERRISLLGNHGIKPPKIAEPWDWMSSELRKTFYDIFEKEDRQSIVPWLEREYKMLYKDTFGDVETTLVTEQNNTLDDFSEVVTNEQIRLNSKFIATRLTPFEGEVIRIINPRSAICTNGKNTWIAILKEYDKKDVLRCIDFDISQKSLEDLLITHNNKVALTLYEYNGDTDIVLRGYDLETGLLCGVNEAYDKLVNGVVYKDTCYVLCGITNGLTNGFITEYVIKKCDFENHLHPKCDRIQLSTNLQIKQFGAIQNSKFVIVKQASNTVDEIYCNDTKLCEIICNSEGATYKIIYDDISKRWLVINSEGAGIIINQNGSYDLINLIAQINTNDFNIENITFEKGKIYIPSTDALYIISITGKISTKKMECDKIMTPNSKVYNITNKGFSVLADNVLYEVRKG